MFKRAQEGPRGPKKRFNRGLEISYSRGPKRAQEGQKGPTRRLYRRLEISYSKEPKRAQEGPVEEYIENWIFHIQESPTGPKRAHEEILKRFGDFIFKRA